VDLRGDAKVENYPYIVAIYGSTTIYSIILFVSSPGDLIGDLKGQALIKLL